MNSTSPPEHWLPPKRVRQHFDRASATYDRAAGVISELRTRLLERLDLVKLNPLAILDLGSATGAGARALKDRYRKAQVIALDASPKMAAQSWKRRGWLRPFDVVSADARRLPLRAKSVDLVFSHLMLPWVNEPDAVFAEVARVLRPGGVFMFTTVGPDTARELRGGWGDGATHVHAHLDMHDIGDALTRARLADPVMDVERLTATYSDIDALLSEMRNLGITNAARAAPQGFTGRGRIAAFKRAYESLRTDGRLPLTIEAVYGHAWCVEGTSQNRPNGEIVVPLSRIGRRK